MEKLTITLTDRPPVRVDKEQWPIIASAKDWDNEHEFQANRTWHLKVRQHEDGRCIVYGIYSTNWHNENDLRGGELVDDVACVPETIKSVADYLGFNARLADECIADLPAEDL